MVPLGLLAGADASVLEMLYKNFLPYHAWQSVRAKRSLRRCREGDCGELPHHHHQGHWLRLDGFA